MKTPYRALGTAGPLQGGHARVARGSSCLGRDFPLETGLWDLKSTLEGPGWGVDEGYCTRNSQRLHDLAGDRTNAHVSHGSSYMRTKAPSQSCFGKVGKSGPHVTKPAGPKVSLSGSLRDGHTVVVIYSVQLLY